jgi:hypothetical protein
MRRCAAVLLVLSLLAATGQAGRAEEDLDDLLGGFEDETAAPPEDDAEDDAEEGAPSPSAPRRWLPDWLDVKGELSIGASYGLIPHRTAALPDRKSWNGPNRLRGKLDLEVDAQLPGSWKSRVSGFGFYDAIYRLRDRDEYTRDARDVYEQELELQEAWILGSPHDRVDLKVGRQILNWGRSDTLRVLDVINPLDNRDPGLVDIENLRRPVGMARVDGYLGDWRLTGLVIPELRFEKQPPFGSDYVPSAARLPETDTPDSFSDDPEFGGALTGVFRGWDVSLHALRYWTNRPRLELVPPRARFTHDRHTLVGAGGNVTLGNWLLKGEAAWIDGVRFSHADETDRIDAMAGVEYYGFEDVTIALEVVNRHIVDWDLAAKRAPDFAEEDFLETALRVNADLMNARLHLLALVIVLGERAQNGAISRFQASWELRDALSITGGVLFYMQGDIPPIDDWGDNDRLFTELEWSF